MAARVLTKILALCFGVAASMLHVDCFQAVPTWVIRGASQRFSQALPSSLVARRRRSFDDDDEETEGVSSGIPQLPAFGASSFSTHSMDVFARQPPSPTCDSADAAFVSPKFKLQYTCNVCDTRNSHMVSRLGKLNNEI